MPECRHQVEAAACADCSPRVAAFLAQPAGTPARDYGPWFSASFGGGCDGCGGEICAGDRIRADGEGGWLCEECGSYDGIDTLTGVPALNPEPARAGRVLGDVQPGERGPDYAGYAGQARRYREQETGT